MGNQETGKVANGSGGDDRRMKVGLRRGIHCFFDVDDITISFWGSAWSGREIVRVDDRVVSDKRSFRLSTPHRFEHKGVQYELRFGVASIVRSQYHIELYRNGELLDSDTASHFKTVPGTDKIDWRSEARSLLVWVLLGIVVGVVAAMLFGGQ